jgi:TetR/AcrR family transcriptional repressor of nem operon
VRYPEAHKEETRERIVAAAAASLRASGVDGIGVADLMRAAGLTHGGFYAHFSSKEELVGEAASTALGQTIAHLRDAAEKAPRHAARQAIVDAYLNGRHRDHPDKGCAVAAIGADLARLAPETRGALEQRLEEMFALLEEHCGARSGGRHKAIAMFSTMVGALLLSRAVRSRALSEEILEAARNAL